MERLREFAIVMLILGLNMLLIPSMFEKPGKLQVKGSESLYIGGIMTALGAVILIWQIVLWFKEQEDKEKNNDKTYNDNFSSK